MWKKVTLTTANNTANVSFTGGGSIYAEGTFGGGSVELHIVYVEKDGGQSTVSSGFIHDAIDGATVKSISCTSGHYQLDLSGSTGASVDVYYNDQVVKSVIS